MADPEAIYIYGCGEHAMVVATVLEDLGIPVAGMFEDHPGRSHCLATNLLPGLRALLTEWMAKPPGRTQRVAMLEHGPDFFGGVAYGPRSAPTARASRRSTSSSMTPNEPTSSHGSKPTPRRF